jgi:AbrB family looped-hinge helix DNA binding protein
VTTTLSAKGQVLIPADVRHRLGLRPGTDFTILSSADGKIMLTPVESHGKKKGLGEALRALRGLEIKRYNEPVRITRL